MRRFKLAWRLAKDNLRANRRLNHPLIIATSTLVMIFIMLESSIDKLNLTGRTTAALIHFGEVIITIFSILFIIYARSFILRQRTKEMGLLIALGLGKREFSLTYFFEMIVTYLATMVLGIVLALIFTPLTNLLNQSLLGLEPQLDLSLQTTPIVLATFVFAGIFVFSFLFELIKIARRQSKEIFDSGKDQMQRVKVRPGLALLSLLLILPAYVMAIISRNLGFQAILIFFFAIIMVIVGTYALYHAFVPWILSLMQKNKRYYHKPAHFIQVSSLIHSLKAHASGLASITILACMMLVTFTATINLFFLTPKKPEMLRTHGRHRLIVYEADTASLRKSEPVDGSRYLPSQANLRSIKETYDRLRAEVFQSQETALEPGQTVLLPAFYYTFQGREDSPSTVLHLLPKEEMTAFLPEIQYEEGRVLIGHGEALELGREYCQQVLAPDSACDLPIQQGILDPYTDLYYAVPRAEFDQAYQAFHEAFGHNFSYELNYFEPLDLPFQFDTKRLKAEQEFSNTVWSDRAHELLMPEIERVSGPEGPNYYIHFNSDEMDYLEVMNIAVIFLYIGIMCSLTFLIGMAIVSWFKQYTQAESERLRIETMQKLGLSEDIIKKAVHSQIFWLLVLPLVVASLHVAFAYPYLYKMFDLMGFGSTALLGPDLSLTRLFLKAMGISLALVYLCYYLVYKTSAGSYWRTIQQKTRQRRQSF